MNDWESFQRDVLDTVRQYRGYFDFLETIGSTKNEARPDCVARITRKEKKQVLVIDAKSKSEIKDEDISRMNNYLEMLKNNPVDIETSFDQINDHEFTGVFVTPVETDLNDSEFQVVPIREFHQFLQTKLLYTDTRKMVRKVAKLAERGQLSQGEMRTLFQGLEPYRKRHQEVIKHLETIESQYQALTILEKSEKTEDPSLDVDTILRHKPTDTEFLVDIPYSNDAFEDIETRIKNIRDSIDSEGRKYYSIISDSERSENAVVTVKEFEQNLKQAAGILPLRDIGKLLDPNIPTRKFVENGKMFIEAEGSVEFRTVIASRNDNQFEIRMNVPNVVAQAVQDKTANTPSELGQVNSSSLKLMFETKPGVQVKLEGSEEGWESLKDRIQTMWMDPLNRKLSKEFNKTERARA